MFSLRGRSPAKASTYFTFCIGFDRLVQDFGQFPGNVCWLFQILMKSLNDTHINDLKWKLQQLIFWVKGRASDFFQDWLAEVTHGAKHGGSFSEAYQTYRHLSSILYRNTDTLTADYTIILSKGAT